MRLSVGADAPDREVIDSDGQRSLLSEHWEHQVLYLFFTRHLG